VANTPRGLAAILDLFADNASGAISPQDLRDFVVSVMGETLSEMNNMWVEMEALRLGQIGVGIENWAPYWGCQVIEHSPSPDMSVDVRAGNVHTHCKAIFSEPLPYEIAGQTVPISAADGVYGRVDRITISETDGAVVVLTGTPAPLPKAAPPDRIVLDSNDPTLALVYVPAGCTAILNEHIADKRVAVRMAPVIEGRWLRYNTADLAVSILQVANYAYISRVLIQVTEGFNSSGTNLLTVGVGQPSPDGDHDALVTALDVSTPGIKTPSYGPSMGWTGVPLVGVLPLVGLNTIRAYYTAGGSAPTTGEVLVIVEYIPVFYTHFVP